MERMRMQLPNLYSITRSSTALALAGLLAVSGWAQQSQPSSVPQAPSASKTTAPANAFVVGEYSKPHSHFPNPIAPYTSRTLPPPSLANTPRIQDLLRDGKLMLSMNDAVALALENNMDIAIQRYNLSIADTDILRTKSGATFLGVNTGIVQNTPGGTTGGFSTAAGTGPGGTSAGA